MIIISICGNQQCIYANGDPVLIKELGFLKSNTHPILTVNPTLDNVIYNKVARLEIDVITHDIVEVTLHNEYKVYMTLYQEVLDTRGNYIPINKIELGTPLLTFYVPITKGDKSATFKDIYKHYHHDKATKKRKFLLTVHSHDRATVIQRLTQLNRMPHSRIINNQHIKSSLYDITIPLQQGTTKTPLVITDISILKTRNRHPMYTVYTKKDGYYIVIDPKYQVGIITRG